MMTLRFLFLVLPAVAAISSPVLASDVCESLAAKGVYDFTKTSGEATFDNQLLSWLERNEFATEAQARQASGNVGLTIPAEIPIPFSAEFAQSDSSGKNWGKALRSYLQAHKSEKQKFSKETRMINVEALKQLTNCQLEKVLCWIESGIPTASFNIRLRDMPHSQSDKMTITDVQLSGASLLTHRQLKGRKVTSTLVEEIKIDDSSAGAKVNVTFGSTDFSSCAARLEPLPRMTSHLGIGGPIQKPQQIGWLPASTSSPFNNGNQQFWCYKADRTGTVSLDVSRTAYKVTLWAFQYDKGKRCGTGADAPSDRLLQEELPPMPDSSATREVDVVKDQQYAFGIQPMDGIGSVTFFIRAK